MNAILLTKAHQFWPLTEYMSGFGVPVGRYIDRFHLPQKILDAPDLYIDEARFWRLAGDMAKREGFLDWGFRAAQELDLSVLGEFGTQLLRQPTLKTGLEKFVATVAVESVNSCFGLMHLDTDFWLTLRGYRGAPAGREVIELYDLQWMITLVQSALGDQWLPSAVHLQSAYLPEGLHASELCTGNIRFSSTMTALIIPEASMATPMTNYRASSPANCSSQNDALDKPDFATSLRYLLTGYINENLTVGNSAELVGTSERTLQRKLAEQGTSFNQLLDQVRFDTAKQLLQNEQISVTDIAGELGYNDPANFSRAFRRWAGVSPRKHRQLFK